ncbi:unnamed protein product, partial [Urochloa humidicola]
LTNALIASPINSSTPNPVIQDVRLAVQNKFDPSAQPTKIESSPPIYILYIRTSAMEQATLSYGIIQGPNFMLRLSPWIREYKCHKIAYNTLAQLTSKCTATDYAHGPAAIPADRTLGSSYSHGEELHSIPLKLYTSLHNEPKKQSITQVAKDTYKGTGITDASNNYDP